MGACGFSAQWFYGFLAIHMIIGIVMAPETRGKTLEEIQEERYGKAS